MSVRHVISLVDLGAEAIAQLVDRSVAFARSRSNGRKPLAGKIVGLYFPKPSTRTRTSFTVGALKLGAQTVTFGAGDLQLATGETIKDSTNVLSGYLDALVIRTNDNIEEMRVWAEQDRMAVINAMSDIEHPTQAIADLSTLKEHFGDLENLHLLYLGEGNNSAVALAYAVAQTPGMRITLVTPKGYGFPQEVIQRAQRLAHEHGAIIQYHHDAADLPLNVDAVYTTRWQTMGVPHPEPNWRDKFWPYSVTSALMARVSKPSTIFMHDLPAVWGEDVEEDVLYGPQSLAWRQARHKMFSAMSVLEWCLDVGVSKKKPAAEQHRVKSAAMEAFSASVAGAPVADVIR
jgi:ornithine carbamoyltransferase